MPMSERIVSRVERPASGTKGTHTESLDRAKTYEQRLEQGADELLALSFLELFELLQEDEETTDRDQMCEFTSITLEEWPGLLVYVEGKLRHIKVLWGGEKVPIS